MIRTRRHLARLLPVLLAFSLAPPAPAGDPARVGALAATDWDGRAVEVRPGAGADFTVAALLSLECPVSNSYVAPLTAMAADYAGRGVAFVGLLPGERPGDALRKRFAEFKVGFPVHLDPDLAAADALGAATVPEVFVLDKGGQLRYRGRIDDAYGARLKRNPAVTSHNLRDALDALLAGKPVERPVTVPVGCAIFRGAKEPAKGDAASVTYHKDVAPILAQHCQGCHRPGQVGPFSLTTYKHAVTWADDIRTYTQSREMPPWKPVGGPGYRNERVLSDGAIATLARWVEQGCPEGEAVANAPAPRADDDGWELGPPDLILTPAEPFQVAASGKDIFRCFVIPTGLTEDKYVVGYEVKPGNPRVVHHALNYWDRTGKARELEAKERARSRPDAADRGPGYNSAMGIGVLPVPMAERPDVPPIWAIGGWAPGIRATALPKGAGYLLPKGADFVVQTHYHRTGKPETDRIRVGLYFAKKPVEKQWQTLAVSGMRQFASIPAGDAEFAAKGSVWLLNDAVLHSVMPHMHLIGRSIKVTMTPPGGEPATLVEIPNWDYNWQESYWFQEPIRAPAGTRLDVEAVYNNSASNPLNPFSPPRRITFGEETTNEMLFGFVGATPAGAGKVRVRRPSLLEQLGLPAKAGPK